MVTTVIGHAHAGWMFWIGDGECDEAIARHFSGANFVRGGYRRADEWNTFYSICLSVAEPR